MKYIAALVLLALSVTAQAEHHRGHSIMHLDNAILRLGQSITFAESYRDADAAGMLPEDQLSEYRDMLSLYGKGLPCPYRGRVLPTEHCIAAWVGVKRAEFPKPDFPQLNAAYDHIFHANKYDIYATKYLERLQAARDGLASGQNLDETRRLLNAPGMGSEIDSGLWGTIQVAANIHLAVRDDSPNLNKLQKVLLLHRTAAGIITWALWHNNDAIREEIYQDPEFICSGPGNHCE